MNENLINADNLDPHEILNVSQNASFNEIRK
jgi:curved DNA-binding protein CbpA